MTNSEIIADSREEKAEIEKNNTWCEAIELLSRQTEYSREDLEENYTYYEIMDLIEENNIEL